MKIFIVLCNGQSMDCRWSKLKKKTSGYYKVDREFLLNFLGQKIFDILVRRGMYESGDDSEKESDIYIQRFILTLVYIIIGLQVHHLLKNLAQNDFAHLVPIEVGIHQKVDRMDFLEGIDKSLKIERTEQIKQFADEEEKKLRSRNYFQSREETIIEILELSVSGMSVDEIVQAMDGKICDKKVREYINLFPQAEGFLKYLKAQENQEFADLYSNLDQKWQCLIDWEQRRDKNIAEFLIEKMGKEVINSGSAFTPQKQENQWNHYGYINEEEM